MSSPDFPAPFLDALDRATLASDGRPEGNEVRFRCPAEGHPDKHPSARWNRQKAVWRCDACGVGGGALDLADRLGVEKPAKRKGNQPNRSTREGVKPFDSSHDSASQDVEVSDAGVNLDAGITLQQLAEAKKLPLPFLRSLGLRDKKRDGVPTVVMPYLDANGEEAGIRYRHRLDANGKRFSWRTGDRVTLYGLHRLAEIRKAGWSLLVEGESDCWTCWHYGIPALGVPGKTHWKQEWRFLLRGLSVFVWREPGAQDFVDRVARDLADVQVVTPPDGTKDLSEAHCRGDDVAELVERLKTTAVPAKELTAANMSGARGRLLAVCSAVMDADDPLTVLRTEITRLGYGGDITPALITYLSVTTRLLAMRRGSMPSHLLLLGPPSAGKSYTLAIVLSLLPEDAYHAIDAGSPRVLIYDAADLKHRVLIFAEADSLPAGEDNPAASAVRNLLQDHRLHYQVTERDPESGQFLAREISKPGPTLLVTTAVKSLGSQMMTRVFALPVPEDVKRLQQALATQATIELDGVAEPNAALVAFQGYLQTLAPWDVVVPFVRELSDAIAATANASRILRDFQRLPTGPCLARTRGQRPARVPSLVPAPATTSVPPTSGRSCPTPWSGV